MRSGHVYVRARGVSGPALELTATSDRSTVAAGETLSAHGAVTLQVVTERAVGQQVEWVRNGAIVATTTVGSDGRAAYALTADGPGWCAAILRDGQGPTAFTNAIYLTTR